MILMLKRAAWQYPFGDLFRTGATLAMGSDWGVTTADPLRQLEVAVRRVDCASGGCADGCTSDEIAISAFCGANSYPTSLDERNAQCTGANGSAPPAVLICMKK